MTKPLSKVRVRFQPIGHRPDGHITPILHRGTIELRRQLEAIAKRRWPTAPQAFADLQTNEIIVGGKAVARFVIEPIDADDLDQPDLLSTVPQPRRRPWSE